MTSAEIVSICIGVGIPAGGGLFWLGRLQGRVTSLEKENKNMKERLDKTELDVTKNGKLVAKFSEGVEFLKEGQTALFNKLDKMSSALMDHIQRTNP